MNVNIHKLNSSELPEGLKNLYVPPQQLFWAGQPLSGWLDKPKLAIVGSRKISTYGRLATELFASQAARVGMVVISGLAYGVDAQAHRAALAAGGSCVAVMPTGLDKVYPTAHLNLAGEIMQRGSLISEYPVGQTVYKTNFIARNRLISGLCDGLLVTEAAVNSGSLHTARFAMEQGKAVMAIPGNINSPGSVGCNNLIKSGAIAVTDFADIAMALGLNHQANSAVLFQGSSQEEVVYRLIKSGVSDQAELINCIDLDQSSFSGILTSLELNGYIKPAGAGSWFAVG